MTLSRKPTAWLLAALCIGVAAAYGPGMNGPFVLDDQVSVVGTRTQSWQLDEWLEATTSKPTGPLRRPLAYLSFALNERIATRPDGSLATWPYKLVNLLIHLGNGLLVFLLARHLARHARYSDGSGRWLGLLACGFWLAHPLHVSTVFYVVQRMTLLSTTAVIVACLLFVRAGWDLQGLRQRLWLWLGIGVCLVAGALFKENALVAPFLFLCLAAALPRSTDADAPPALAFRALSIWFPLLAAATILATQPGLVLNGYSDYAFTPAQRLMTQLHVLPLYLGALLTLRPGFMGFVHDDVLTVTEPTGTTAILAGLLVASVLVALLIRRRWPLAALGLLWFPVAHLMESSIFALEHAYEHRNYLPSIGIALILGEGVTRIAARAPSKILLRSALAAIFVLIVTLTGVRAFHWSSQYRMSVHQFQQHPSSSRALVSAFVVAMNHQDLEGARLIHGRMMAVDPLNPLSGLLNLHMNCVSGQLTSAQQLAELRLQMRRSTPWRDALSMFQRLVQLRAGGHCPKILPEDLIQITEWAIGNPFVLRSPDLLQKWLQARAAAVAFWRDPSQALASVDVALSIGATNELIRSRVDLLFRAGQACAAADLIQRWPSTGVEQLTRPRATIRRLSEAADRVIRDHGLDCT